jgi:hypothetical protein
MMIYQLIHLKLLEFHILGLQLYKLGGGFEKVIKHNLIG